LKIIYLSSARLPSRAANGIQVMRMCEAFAALGNELTLFCTDTGNSIEAFEFYGVARTFRIREVTQPTLRGGVYWYAVKTGFAARIAGADLVYARCLPSGFVAARLGLPIMLEVHTDIRDYGRKCERLFLSMLKAKNLRRVVVISQSLKRRLCEAYGVDEKVILVAPDAAVPIQPSALCERTDGSLDIGYTGHLYRGRGLELIVELARRLPWARFHVVGGDPEEVVAWRARCAEDSNVIFHGFVDPGQIDAVRARFDVLLAPYQRSLATQGGGADTVRWMSPLKIFEYMATGRPIVASRLPVLEEILEDEGNALLCEPDDVDEWEQALRRLHDDSVLRKRIAHKARRDFETRYTWERRATHILAAN
jgi:glycosyltransferase involved in cell wall biosynthesis